MPRFEEKIPDSKRKKEKSKGSMQLVVGFFLLVMIFIFIDDNFWRLILYFIFGVNYLGIGIKNFNDRKPLYFEFDDTRIEWLVFEKSSQIAWVSWDTIKWIKKENSGGITFFRESSFSEHFTMKWMTEEQQNQMFAQIEETANSKQIRLVNF